MSMLLATAPPQAPTSTPRPRAVGGGIGGLAAAVRLGAYGYHATGLDRLLLIGALCSARILDQVVPHAAAFAR